MTQHHPKKGFLMFFKRSARAAACVAVLSTVGLVASGVGTFGASSAGASGSSFHLSSPLKLTFLWEIKGETANGISDFQDGAQIAINQINAAGGVGGKPIKWNRLTYDAVNPQPATASFLQAVQGKPSVIIGLVGPSADAVVPDITRAAIPSLGLYQDSTLDNGPKSGSPWLFLMQAKFADYGLVGAKYLVQDLHQKNVGLLTTNEAYGLGANAAASGEFKSLGVTPIANREVPPTATDLTPQILAMKSASGQAAFVYPNIFGALMTQDLQNGISIPTVSGSEALLAEDEKLIPPKELPNVYSVAACNPAATNASAKLKVFSRKYEAKYGVPPSNFSAEAYDSIYLAAAAAKQAKSTAPAKLKSALASINFKGGICVANYHSDPAHLFVHQVQVNHLTASGGATIVASISYPPSKAGT
jgi:ABC-type branched-subunit amino acid transport system substrate-binding protein